MHVHELGQANFELEKFDFLEYEQYVSQDNSGTVESHLVGVSHREALISGDQVNKIRKWKSFVDMNPSHKVKTPID